MSFWFPASRDRGVDCSSQSEEGVFKNQKRTVKTEVSVEEEATGRGRCTSAPCSQYAVRPTAELGAVGPAGVTGALCAGPAPGGRTSQKHEITRGKSNKATVRYAQRTLWLTTVLWSSRCRVECRVASVG
uniref:Uncharacterized protein n=1 Tax=Molossus molossus TaxID=27622 RepID=A0A7J8GKM6_MOLMO|nr:hypothetical protein HJG59_011528 [Molossus molossus]